MSKASSMICISSASSMDSTLTFSHGHQRIVIDVVRKLTGFMGDHEIEDVIIPRIWRLVSNTRLFKKICFNVSSSHPSHVVEPDTDEFSKMRRIVISNSLGIAICF
jgi:hypothetical protein